MEILFYGSSTLPFIAVKDVDTFKLLETRHEEERLRTMAKINLLHSASVKCVKRHVFPIYTMPNLYHPANALARSFGTVCPSTHPQSNLQQPQLRIQSI